eukprot:m.163438 g.163438  ORF g.163438 m.163438 type:complete len:76 (-) comp14385_c0_seq1:676-903(-)
MRALFMYYFLCCFAGELCCNLVSAQMEIDQPCAYNTYEKQHRHIHLLTIHGLHIDNDSSCLHKQHTAIRYMLISN